MYEIKTEDIYENFLAVIKKCLISIIIRQSKYYDDSNKLVIGKIKDKTGGVAIEEFVGLKPKMYSPLVDNNEHKKAKGVNKKVVLTISHNNYKDVLLHKNGDI